jgi:FAD/FMN-containing dehydrogenase
VSNGEKRRSLVTEQRRDELLDSLTEIFGERVKRPRGHDGIGAGGALASALALVQPSDDEEVRRLAEVAAKHSVPLVPLGAGTGFEPAPPAGGILVRFDLMRGVRLPGAEEAWIGAEPGATWLELEEALRPHGRGLAVYPTSAPRATVGGWLTRDGLGVGSFEHGWLSENVVSASVVMVGGERREARGEEIRSFFSPEGARGLIVGAKLKTRRADADVPFAASFPEAETLAGAVEGLMEARPPLWHVALLNPAMSRARASAEAYVLFGAYAREHEAEVASPLGGILESHRGRVLGAADAHRVWGERFFPIAPSHPTPEPTDRVLADARDLPKVLERLSREAVQGTVARSGEVLVLAFEDTLAEDRAR